MWRAIGVDPTKLTASMSGCSRMRSTASRSPFTTLKQPGREPRLVQQLGQEERGGRVLLRRLEDERVAARERVGEHPHGDHRREVERRDAGHHPERLAQLVHVDARRRLLGVRALQQVRDAARELDVLEATSHLAERVGQHLAVLGGEQRRDLLAVGVDQLPQVEQDLGPARQVRGPPCREGGRARRRPRRRPPQRTRSRPRPAACRWPGSTPARCVPRCPRRSGRRSSG